MTTTRGAGDAVTDEVSSAAHSDGAVEPVCRTRRALLALCALCTLLSPDGYTADVTMQWDYDWQLGATGFAVYCGASPRDYANRTDAGNTDRFTLSVPQGAVQFCSLTAYDQAGVESDFSNEIGVSLKEDTGTVEFVPPFGVGTQGLVVPTPSGVRVRLSVPFDRASLNLFSAHESIQRTADLTLTGVTTGPVRGSLLIDADDQGFTVVKTGGVFLPDTYTLTIASRPDTLLDLFGRTLDGNGDGFPGDDYELSFAVTPSVTPILGIGEFARGPGQPVNLPADNAAAGIPVTITNGAAIHEIAFTLHYNPALLLIEDVGLNSSVAGELTLKSIDQLAGLMRIRIANLSGLPNSSTILLALQAHVPADAPYRAFHMMDISDLAFNTGAGAVGGRDDDGLHLVAYIGDASGDAHYSSHDALLVQRVIARLDSGFSAYPLVDPGVVGDVSRNGRLDAGDALLIQRKTVRLPVPQIPD